MVEVSEHRSPRVLFLHRGPRAHSAHEALAEKLGVAARWRLAPYGAPGLPKAILNAWRLAHNDQWDSLLSENPCIEGVFLRLFDRNRRVRIRLDMGSYCLRMAQFPFWERVVRRLEMASWSALVVSGAESVAATRRYVRPSTGLIDWTPKDGWGDPFGRVVSDRTGKVVAIMTGLRDASAARLERRLQYKGLDRVATVSRAAIREGWGPITVYGYWPELVQHRFGDSLRFGGQRTAEEMLRGASVLVHTCRQDGFGLAVLDAMVAGVPPVVSRAGAAELVASVEPRLVVGHDPDEHAAVEAVRWVRSLDRSSYRRLAGRLREEALRYIHRPDEGVRQMRDQLGYTDGAT